MTVESVKTAFEKGEIKAYKLEEALFAELKDWESACRKAAEIRAEFIEKKLKVKISGIRSAYISTSDSKKMTSGIEQKIGGAIIPMGFAGPAKIDGEYAKGEFYIPAATNEAALIAGMNRGIACLNRAGGVKTKITRDCMTRAPVIEFASEKEAGEAVKEIKEKGKIYGEMKKAAEEGATVSKMLDIQVFESGRHVWLRHVFFTGDSMGMNSVTKYTAASVKKFLELIGGKGIGAKLIALSGNMCVDKKANLINIQLGRGKTVELKASVPAAVLKEIYGIAPAAVEKVNLIKNVEGSKLAGTNIGGYNSNAANAVAALFAATGQDLAQVVESSSCMVECKDAGKALEFSITLFCLEVGTIGGGMGFGTAREALEMLGCAGPGKKPGENAKKLAEIIAAAVAAQEINLICTLAREFELADSHISLARGKK
ncbi:3-hydroxy-3-methylglutaryl-coenzyme A reductase [Candidatus Gugararchaeum adminiculabundum]|nr:3-hydroxy-3-methylglutaryl-coenzyme A reductase [Candidatus Gugararchaeum adminiculabundum]